jgi:hypothetical protein
MMFILTVRGMYTFHTPEEDGQSVRVCRWCCVMLMFITSIVWMLIITMTISRDIWIVTDRMEGYTQNGNRKFFKQKGDGLLSLFCLHNLIHVVLHFYVGYKNQPQRIAFRLRIDPVLAHFTNGIALPGE